MTGRDIVGQTTDDILQGQDIISGPLLDNFFLNKEVKVAILLDEFLQVNFHVLAILFGSYRYISRFIYTLIRL